MKPLEYHDVNWLQTPYIGGAYYGSTEPSALAAYGEALEEKFVRIHFAGTETASRWVGTLEGAVRSGERAAAKIFMITKTHDYENYAENYTHSKVEGTVYLLFNDIEKMLAKYGRGDRALDYGCGTGDGITSLRKAGYQTVGADISPEMLQFAKERDPGGEYLLIESAELPPSFKDQFDVALATTVLTEISSKQEMQRILLAIYDALKPNGVLIVSNCSEACYVNDWLSFSCDFPENQNLQSGQNARIYFPNESFELFDYYWTSANYLEIFAQTPFMVREQLYSTVDDEDLDRYPWRTELEKSAWCTFVLQK